nr:hypothetical protein [Tanacetum cinerariifolium]
MDIVAERVARKAAKSKVQSSLNPATKRPLNITLKRDGSGSKEGDGSGSEVEGDEEEDEKKVDKEEDEKEGDEEEDEEEGDKEDDEEKGDEEEDEEDAIVKDEEYKEEEEKGKKIKVEDKEVGEKKRKKNFEPSYSEDEKPLKKKTKGKGKDPIPSFFHAIRDAKVNMSFMEDILALHSVNIDNVTNRLARFVVRAFDSKTYNFYLKTGVVHVTAEKFAPKKKKRIFATDIAEKLVRSTRVDFMFKVNFLMLFANVMGKADMMRAFVNLSVVRRIREDTNIGGVDWCDIIHRCLAISHEPNTVSGFYNGPLRFLIKSFQSISKEKAEVETLLKDANKEFPNDDNVKQLFEQYKGFFKETVLLEEAKAQKAPQNVKPKPAAMKTKEAAEKPKPAENVKELAEKPKEPAEKAQKAPQNVKPKPAAVKTKEAAEKPMLAENVKELSEKPKKPVGDDYQVVCAATVMKAEDRKEFEVETFTQWIEGNIDWVGKDELHAWSRVVEPVNMVQPSTPKRVFSLPSKKYVKPVKPVNSPYMCTRIDVTAPCKRIEFMLGNSLFAMEGDKYETVFQFWVVIVNYLRVSSRLSDPNKSFFPTGCINQGIIKGTLTEKEQWKSFYDKIKAQFKYEPSSMSLSDFELIPKNNLKLQENRPVDGLVLLFIKNHIRMCFAEAVKE